MLAAVRKLLELPRCNLDRGLFGLRETTRLAWVRLTDILITPWSNFPYHRSVEGLARLASSLITEQADPNGMARILGDNYWVSTVAAPHGLLHDVSVNGNHRTAAIKAAGFPVALVHTTRYDGPWEFPPLEAQSRTVRVFLRLLFRAGLLSKPHRGRDGISAEASSWANLLFADTVAETLRKRRRL